MHNCYVFGRWFHPIGFRIDISFIKLISTADTFYVSFSKLYLLNIKFEYKEF